MPMPGLHTTRSSIARALRKNFSIRTHSLRSLAENFFLRPFPFRPSPCIVLYMDNDSLYTFPAAPRFEQTGTPLCTCRLGEFGGIEVEDPNCEGTDMH